MYLGSMVEQGLTAEIYEEPWHPYTKELLRAMLPLDPKKAARQKRLILKETRNRSQKTVVHMHRDAGMQWSAATKKNLEAIGLVKEK